MIRIAFIGSGMINIGILTSLLNNNNITNDIDIYLFDRNTNVGGFWNSNKFENLSIQTNTNEYYIDGYEWEENKNNANKKEIIEYFSNIIKKNKTKIKLSLNMDVKKIIYDKNLKKYTIYYLCTNKNINYKYDKLFDFIIHKSESSIPNIPIKTSIPYYHYNELSKCIIDDICNKYKNIVILGGGKGSYEIVYSFSKRKKHVTWLCKELYHVYDFETRKIILYKKSTKHVQRNTYCINKINEIDKFSNLIISKNIKITNNTITYDDINLEYDCLVYCTGYKKETLNVCDINEHNIDENDLNSFFSNYNKTCFESGRYFGKINASFYGKVYNKYIQHFIKDNNIDRSIIYNIENNIISNT
jgi:thioredoxin reductase